MTDVVKKRKRIMTDKKTKWWRSKIKDEKCYGEFRGELLKGLGGTKDLPDDWTTAAPTISETGRCLVSPGWRQDDKEICWWNSGV